MLAALALSLSVAAGPAPVSIPAFDAAPGLEQQATVGALLHDGPLVAPDAPGKYRWDNYRWDAHVASNYRWD